MTMVELDPYDTCYLRLEVSLSAQDMDPCAYTAEYKGHVLSGEDGEEEVGKINVRVVDLDEARWNGVSLLDVLDCHDASLAHLMPIVNNHALMPSIQKLVGSRSCPILVIDRIEIEKEYRGHGLGERAVSIACERLGLGCGVAALYAFPTQWEGCVGDDHKQFEIDRKRLIRYYRETGFQPTRFSGIMVKPLW